jgi:hypothetical protein
MARVGSLAWVVIPIVIALGVGSFLWTALNEPALTIMAAPGLQGGSQYAQTTQTYTQQLWNIGVPLGVLLGGMMSFIIAARRAA